MSGQPDVLERLVAELNALPDPGDLIERTQVLLLKAQGKLIAHLLNVAGSPDEKRQILATSEQTLNSIAGALGRQHPGIRLVRQIIAIVSARIEGRPDPVSASPSSAGPQNVVAPHAELLQLSKQARTALLLGGPPVVALAMLIALFVGRSVWRAATADEVLVESQHAGQPVSPAWNVPANPQTAKNLKKLGEVYHHAHDLMRRGPSDWTESKNFGLQAEEAEQLQNEGYYVAWGLRIRDVSDKAAAADFVLAYPSAAESIGGQMLMLDGSVRQMTAAEFKAWQARSQAASAVAALVPLRSDDFRDRDRLQGRWRVVSIVAEGQGVPEIGEKELVFSGDQITWPGDDATGAGPATTTFVIHQETLIRRIEFSDGRSAIYELLGDTLRMCMPIQPQGPLPATFRAEAGDGTVLMELVRVK